MKRTIGLVERRDEVKDFAEMTKAYASVPSSEIRQEQEIWVVESGTHTSSEVAAYFLGLD